MKKMARIKKVIYSYPVTVEIWDDGTKTKSRCDSQDTYDELTGFMLCVFKKVMPAKEMRKMFETYVYGDSDKIKRDKTKNDKKSPWFAECLDNIDKCRCDYTYDSNYAYNLNGSKEILDWLATTLVRDKRFSK